MHIPSPSRVCLRSAVPRSFPCCTPSLCVVSIYKLSCTLMFHVVRTSLGLWCKTSEGLWHQSVGISPVDSSREAALLLHLHHSSSSHQLTDAVTWKSSAVLPKTPTIPFNFTCSFSVFDYCSRLLFCFAQFLFLLSFVFFMIQLPLIFCGFSSLFCDLYLYSPLLFAVFFPVISESDSERLSVYGGCF